MIPEAKLVTPTPAWCIKNALLNHFVHAGNARLKKALDFNEGEVFSEPVKRTWDGCEFWREMRVSQTAIEVEFNENWRERFRNPDWQWHTVPRREVGV